MAPALSTSTAVRGIVCMVVSGVLATAQDAVMKWLTTGYPVGEILFLRALFAYIPIGLLIWNAGGRACLRTNSAASQILRGLLVTGATLIFVIALKLLPFADAIAASFTAPLFVTAFAAPLLGESVGWRRWTAVMVGFAGVLVMLRPGVSLELAMLIPLVSAVTGAFRDVFTRRIIPHENAAGTLFYSFTIMFLISGATLPFSWTTPTAFDLGLLVAAGTMFGACHYLLILAYRYGEAAVVTPFAYTQLLWAVVVGYLIWDQLPDIYVLAGAILVAGSGLYILHRAARRRAA
ncbi:MAG: DMT family transporter [Rhodospirillales bacterium]|nr:DMT family transporter [Rhodospirillales bacterium]